MEDHMNSQKIYSLRGKDFISALADNLIENILLKLPLRDAARTCILSTRWRNSWVKLPVLDLNSDFFQESLQIESQIGCRAKFAMIISQILLIHQGPITDFRLCIRQLEVSPEVDSLIKFLSRNEIKTFFLEIGYKENYKLPSCIFSFLSLIKLDLQYCVIPRLPSTFRGFNCLEDLQLFNVVISAQQVRFIVSNSPSLRVLMLETTVDILHLGIKSPSLHTLLVFKSDQTTEYGQQEEIIQSTAEFFGGLPCLQSLQMDARSVRSLFAGGIPARLLTLSAHVKLLRLYGIDLGEADQLSCLLCFLRSAPGLRELELIREAQYQNWNLRLIGKFQEEDVTLNSLEEVTMEDVVGGTTEMKLIKLLLSKSLSLRKLSVSLATHEILDNGLNFFKEMSMFKRAAPNVEVFIQT